MIKTAIQKLDEMDLSAKELVHTGDISTAVAVAVPPALASAMPARTILFGLPYQELVVYIALAGLVLSFISHILGGILSIATFLGRKDADSDDSGTVE